MENRKLAQIMVPKHSGINFGVVKEPTPIDRFFPGPFWCTQQLYFRLTLPSHMSHGTDTIMTRYDTGRTEIPFGPFDVCIWVSPFLVQDNPIEGTPHQCPSCVLFAEPLN
jgi:hypothetical protein